MHYRAFFASSEFLTSADLYDEKTDTFRELTATIAKVAPVVLTGKKGKKDGRPGIYFKESKSGKPLGVNATNAAAISNVTGSTNTKDWIGKRITLRVEMITIRGESEGPRPAIRVVPFRPDQQSAATGATPAPGGPPTTPDEDVALDKAADEWPGSVPR
jgi:hypothetical protein